MEVDVLTPNRCHPGLPIQVLREAITGIEPAAQD